MTVNVPQLALQGGKKPGFISLDNFQGVNTPSKANQCQATISLKTNLSLYVESTFLRRGRAGVLLWSVGAGS